MQQTLKRRFFWVAGLLVVLAAGYTAGYLLAPPPPAAISRTLPQAPADAPQPLTPDGPEGAYRTGPATRV